MSVSWFQRRWWLLAMLLALAIGVFLVKASFSDPRGGEMIRLGEDIVAEDLAFSPDGQAIAIATSQGLQVWELPDQRLRWTGSIHASADDNPLYVVAWSPDGQSIATDGVYNEVQLWHASDGALAARLSGHRGAINQVAWNADGTLLASASRDGTARIWTVHDGNGTLMQTLAGERNQRGESLGITSVAFSPDGRLVATAEPRAIQVWQVSDGRRLRAIPTSGYRTETIAFSPDGALIAAGGQGDYSDKPRTIQLWQVADGTLVRTIAGHWDTINSIAFSPNGQFLASGTGQVQEWSWWGGPAEAAVRLWRVSDGSLVWIRKQQQREVTAVAVSPDGQTVASASRDGTVGLWPVS